MEKKKLIEDFSYIFLKNDRVGFVGHNGCGKTTLMKIIDGRVKPDAGELVIGQTIKIGYYSREIEKDASAGVAYMDPSLKVIEYIRNTAEYVRTEDGLVSASAMLERFLFPPEEQYGVIGKLSGGEKRRLNLLRVLMEAPNVLILDEPTNDLDITTLAILEDYLDNYDGIVITVSHDRYFLDRIAKRIFAFEQGNIRQYEGGYTDYLAKRPEDETALGNAGTETSGKKADQTENADAIENTERRIQGDLEERQEVEIYRQEQKDYETIEDDIAALEAKLEELDEKMGSFASDFVKLNELTQEKIKVEDELEHKMERWEYLEELNARIKAQDR